MKTITNITRNPLLLQTFSSFSFSIKNIIRQKSYCDEGEDEEGE
jgi:hypothetical protein